MKRPAKSPTLHKQNFLIVLFFLIVFNTNHTVTGHLRTILIFRTDGTSVWSFTTAVVKVNYIVVFFKFNATIL